MQQHPRLRVTGAHRLRKPPGIVVREFRGYLEARCAPATLDVSTQSSPLISCFGKSHDLFQCSSILAGQQRDTVASVMPARLAISRNSPTVNAPATESGPSACTIGERVNSRATNRASRYP